MGGTYHIAPGGIWKISARALTFLNPPMRVEEHPILNPRAEGLTSLLELMFIKPSSRQSLFLAFEWQLISRKEVGIGRNWKGPWKNKLQGSDI